MKRMLPCPFCGRMPEEQHKRANGNVYYYVGCYECLAEGPYSIYSYDDAIDLWNNRHSQEERK